MAFKIERRQYPRVSLTHVTVEVYDSEGQPNQPEFCFIINVSENGMLFKSESPDDAFATNRRVRVTFTLPYNNVVIRTDADIIHIQETELSRYIGVQFKNLGQAEHNFLKKFVEESLHSS